MLRRPEAAGEDKGLSQNQRSRMMRESSSCSPRLSAARDNYPPQDPGVLRIRYSCCSKPHQSLGAQTGCFFEEQPAGAREILPNQAAEHISPAAPSTVAAKGASPDVALRLLDPTPPVVAPATAAGTHEDLLGAVPQSARSPPRRRGCRCCGSRWPDSRETDTPHSLGSSSGPWRSRHRLQLLLPAQHDFSHSQQQRHQRRSWKTGFSAAGRNVATSCLILPGPPRVPRLGLPFPSTQSCCFELRSSPQSGM